MAGGGCGGGDGAEPGWRIRQWHEFALKSVWQVVLAFFGVVFSAIIIAVIALSPAADGICRPGLLRAICDQLNLNPPRTQPLRDAGNESQVLRALEGRWGLAGCRSVFEYRLGVSAKGDTLLIARGQYERTVGRVTSVGPDVVYTRTIEPADNAGAHWELRPGDGGARLTMIDRNGVPTVWERCP